MATCHGGSEAGAATSKATPSYDAGVAASLLPLAQLAEQTTDLNNVFLPLGPGQPGWDKLANVSCVGQPYQYPAVRGFLVKGRVGADTRSSAVLALGIDWRAWLTDYRAGPMSAYPIGSWSGAPPEAQITLVYETMYSALRSSLWDSLRFLDGMTLRVTAKGLAAPLAQIAALDLRAGNEGPQSASKVPAGHGVETVCAFSAGAISNDSLSTYFESAVPGAFAITVGTEAIPVDAFPLHASGDNAARLGTAVPVAADVPEFDVPWVERSGSSYAAALKSISTQYPQKPASVTRPAGFDQARAHLFADLCAVAYQRYQHPTGKSLNVSPFVVGPSVTSGGVNVGTIFTSTDAVVAALRGPCTWQEFVDQSCNSDTGSITLQGQQCAVHSGALALLQSMAEPGGTTTLLDDLSAKLKAAVGSTGKPIYLAGHDLGGAVASLAAMELVSAGSLAVEGLYTFGSIPAGGSEFAALSGKAFADKAFHVARDVDPIPALVHSWAEYTGGALPAQVAVQGIPPDDDYPHHSIKSYSQLLNP